MSCLCDTPLPPIYKGDDAALTLVVMLPDGTSMNFNGKTVKFIVKKSKTAEDSTAIIEKTYTPIADITELPVLLTKEDTNVTPGIYQFGVRVIVDGLQTTEGAGQLEIRQGPFYGD